MGINRRLHKLEGALSASECPSCGWSPPDWGNEEIIIEWPDVDGTPERTEEPTICPTCGQHDFIVIEWEDLDED
jgi:predicted RNA-binding Zn-ribbon protein involved in translation (DUF1610 family)